MIMNSETRQCQNCKKGFVIEPEDFEFYARVKVPPPTFCPECRAKRRMVYRNERNLWKCKSDATGKEIFSMFRPGTFAVYERDYWWSDKWGAGDYAQEYDFSKPLFSQIASLMKKMPWFNLSVVDMVDTQYSNNANELKNCYLLFNSGFCENTAYSTGAQNCKDSFDLLDCTFLERAYEDFYCHHSYEIFYSVGCENCNNVWFSKDCVGCSFCFGCAGLRNKSHYIFNKPYAKEEYFLKLKELFTGSYKELKSLRDKAWSVWMAYPTKFTHVRQSANIRGDYIFNSKNVFDSFWVKDAEDCRYLQNCYFGIKRDSYDLVISGLGVERCYDSEDVGIQVADVRFSWLAYMNCFRAEYCMNCHDISNCFACVGLRNKSYCILNKQYSKEDYEKLVPRIIEHMNEMPYVDKKGRIYKYGEFFPTELSPFAYNETIAQEYFPLTKEQAIEQGYSWRDPETRDIKITIKAEELPDHIKDVKDDILKEIIGCAHEAKCNEQCTLGFRIIPQELEFYKKMNLPLPRLCRGFAPTADTTNGSNKETPPNSGTANVLAQAKKTIKIFTKTPRSIFMARNTVRTSLKPLTLQKDRKSYIASGVTTARLFSYDY